MVLELDDVRRSYGLSKQVLRGVSLSLKQGEVVGLLGRNGAGKTTLLHIIMGMLFAHGGNVRVFGKGPWQDPVGIKRRTGFVSERQILPDRARVKEVIALHRALFPTWDTALEAELCSRFEIDRGARIRTLSKGEARLVALLCAVAHRPELLVLDEPAGGLDVAMRREFLETAVRLLSEEGTTILFASHHLQDVERLAARVVLLEEGVVMVDEALHRLQEHCCLAMIDATQDPGRLEHCLRARRHDGKLRLVLQLAPEQGETMLRQRGITDPHCTALPLEDLVIELTGRSS